MSLVTWGSPKARTAASVLLDRVIGEERDRLTLTVSRARFGLAALNLVLIVPDWGQSPEQMGYSSVTPSLVGAAAYFVMSALVLAVVSRWPGARRFASFAPAVVDVPLVGTTELLQATLALTPGLGTQASVAYLMALSLLSVLALSRTVVIATALPTTAFLWAILHVTKVPVPIRVGVTVGSLGALTLAWIVVGQVRALVRLSRQADLLGKYVLGERLGAGGMAEVFLATYSPEGGFERKVALKRMLPAFSENEELLTLFRREASVGARLAHPNIVQVYDFGVHEQRYFLAMEYVDGAPLSKALKVLVAGGRLPSVPALVYLTHEIASALDSVAGLRAADGQPLGLVHRDLNPPNVLLSRAGEVKVADFGIARVGNQPGITETGVMRGKLVYAAPEQLQGEALDVQTDLYALGLSLLEVASGRRVIQGANDVELATAALQQPIPRLAALRPDAPPALDEAIARLTERDRALRTKAPRELLDAIAPLVRELNALELGRREWAQVVPLAQTGTHALAPALPDREAETKTSPAPVR
ncbi:MAG: serine/threonine protein kinase [Myxococcaceae bacterium]|nr:serine/threonine protein kinase [Myxococcaceae bacterium]